MMTENLMKPGKKGILEDMTRNRDIMLNQVTTKNPNIYESTQIAISQRRCQRIIKRRYEVVHTNINRSAK